VGRRSVEFIRASGGAHFNGLATYFGAFFFWAPPSGHSFIINLHHFLSFARPPPLSQFHASIKTSNILLEYNIYHLNFGISCKLLKKKF